MDNVSIVVSDLKASVDFFKELGMELVGETTVSGDWVGRVIGLKDVVSDIAVLQTPDGHSRLELSSFKTPTATVPADPDLMHEPFNVVGKHRVMFTVDDVRGTVARLQKHGAELVQEIVNYENVYLLCYLRGPDGVMIALAEEIGK